MSESNFPADAREPPDGNLHGHVNGHHGTGRSPVIPLQPPGPQLYETPEPLQPDPPEAPPVRRHIRLKPPEKLGYPTYAPPSPPPSPELHEDDEKKENAEQKTDTTSELKNEEKQDAANDDEKWKCPICLDDLKQPVVTQCGHVFCYPCITEWLRRGQAGENVCPCCHGAVDPHKLIPIYGQGSEADMNSPPPPRPEYVNPERTFQFRTHGPMHWAQWQRGTIGDIVPRLVVNYRMTPQHLFQLCAFIFMVLAFFI